MTRAQIWLATAGGKARPVLVLTRPEVIDVRQFVTVAEITTVVRGLAVEVELDPDDSGVDPASVINCDGIHTIRRSSLSTHVGTVDDNTMRRVCGALAYALGC